VDDGALAERLGVLAVTPRHEHAAVDLGRIVSCDYCGQLMVESVAHVPSLLGAPVCSHSLCERCWDRSRVAVQCCVCSHHEYESHGGL
jgi:ribosomal protein S27E